jgi:hypothetical protein
MTVHYFGADASMCKLKRARGVWMRALHTALARFGSGLAPSDLRSKLEDGNIVYRLTLAHLCLDRPASR